MAEQNSYQDCEDRGYHGPFEGRELYNRLCGWESYGDCQACGAVRYIPREELRKLAAELKEERRRRLASLPRTA